MVNIKSFIFNLFQENTYLVWDEEGSCVAIDPGFCTEDEAGTLRAFVRKEKLSLKAVWLTHGHIDHTFGAAALQREYSVPVLMNDLDRPLIGNALGFTLPGFDGSFTTTPLTDGEVLDTLKDSPFKVVASPGHTPGGVCFYDETDKVLFSGDTLFAGSIGRTDFPGGDYDKLIVSVMDGLMGFPGDVDILPGHGPRTSVADERTQNPFLQPFNEPEQSDGIDWNADGIEFHPLG